MESDSGFDFPTFGGLRDPLWGQPLSAQAGGLCGEASLLRDNLRSVERSREEPDHNPPFWDEEALRNESVKNIVKPKKYNLLTDAELLDPFGPELFDVRNNKTKPLGTIMSIPTVIPAESLGPPTLVKEPNHSILCLQRLVMSQK